MSALAAAPTTPTTLYAGTTVRGIFKSGDGGENWQPLEAPRRGTSVVAVSFLSIDPTSPTTIYAGTTLNCVHKSTDAGTTWEEVGLCSQATSGMVIDPSDPATLYVSTRGEIRTRHQTDAGAHNVFRSSDSGATWETVTPDLPDREPATLCIASIAMKPVPSPTLYANLCDGTSYQSTTRATNGTPPTCPSPTSAPS
ncbi:MAG: hypothetical protein HC884_12210 [Chloroflexaceae bacterium]|nr:hypothetical protein [Chloroflexaceae bacterium]